MDRPEVSLKRACLRKKPNGRTSLKSLGIAIVLTIVMLTGGLCITGRASASSPSTCNSFVIVNGSAPKKVCGDWSTNSYNTPWANTENDWAPCSGYNHWNPGENANTGALTGYLSDEADAMSGCNPDTTEHETQEGLHASSSYSIGGSGTYAYTVTATFDVQSVFISGEAIPCNLNYAHYQIFLGVAVYDGSTGNGYYSWPQSGSTDQTGSTYGTTCYYNKPLSFQYDGETWNPGTLTVSFVTPSVNVNDPMYIRGGVDFLDGSNTASSGYENYQEMEFDNNAEGFGTDGQITLVSLSLT
jgi:hypothetical protein